MAKFEEKGRILEEAEQILKDLEDDKVKYWSVLDKMEERKTAIEQIE